MTHDVLTTLVYLGAAAVFVIILWAVVVLAIVTGS